MRRLMTLFAFVLVGLIMAAGVDAQRRGTADRERRWADTNDRLELRYTLETEEDGEPASVAATQGFESGDRFMLRVRRIFEEGRQLGVKFQVLQERGGRLRRRSTTYPIRSGDRFKFEVETNRPAFVYVLNRTLAGDAESLRSTVFDEIRDDDRRDRSGSRQEYRLLYPRGGERPAAVQAGRRVQLPPGDGRYYVMEEPTGIEKLYVLLSERRIDLSKYFDLDDGRQRTGRRPRRDGAVEDDVLDQLNARLLKLAGNVVVEFADEDAHWKGGGVVGYGVVRDEDGPGVVEVSLRHLPRRRR